ncbi:hypothetical protein FRB94_008435 [Tulasnella sp. JGI-2019a]|nr:hypothetical protein FRB94_008435 [Tulasnella sp. JGI-2019a]KAG9030678.1 hypothetical protein FRB95_003639 [Tulasnella sp. JGI-2019a]
MDTLPVELLQQILILSLHDHPRPLWILCAHSSWAEIAIPILNTHLTLNSYSQISRLIERDQRFPKLSSKSFKFTNRIYTDVPQLFRWISDILERCTDTRELGDLKVTVESGLILMDLDVLPLTRSGFHRIK